MNSSSNPSSNSSINSTFNASLHAEHGSHPPLPSSLVAPEVAEGPGPQTRVIDAAGQEARIAAIAPTGADEGPEHCWLQLADGVRMRIPLHLLEPQDDGSYRLPFALESNLRDADTQLAVPVIEEQLEVARRQVETGGLRVRKRVQAREEVVEQPVRREQLAVERVPVNRLVVETPQTHYEGDTLVVPVLEEVLVVKKRLLLREEVRITRQVQEVPATEQVSLRREQVDVERFETSPQPSSVPQAETDKATKDAPGKPNSPDTQDSPDTPTPPA